MGWLPRYLLTIVLVYAAVALTISFLLVLGTTLVGAYASLVRDAALPGDQTQLSWLQRMASDVKSSIVGVLALSAALQMLLGAWRFRLRPGAPVVPRPGAWIQDFLFGMARALRAVGIGLTTAAWVSILGSETRQHDDVRTYAMVVAVVASVCLSQWFTGLPPSAMAGLAGQD